MILVAWILLVFVVAAWLAYWRLPQIAEEGVAAVSFGLTAPTLIAFGPPLLLGVAWVLVRGGRSRS